MAFCVEGMTLPSSKFGQSVSLNYFVCWQFHITTAGELSIKSVMSVSAEPHGYELRAYYSTICCNVEFGALQLGPKIWQKTCVSVSTNQNVLSFISDLTMWSTCSMFYCIKSGFIKSCLINPVFPKPSQLQKPFWPWNILLEFILFLSLAVYYC